MTNMRTYFAHCPPIVEPPVYYFTVVDRGSICHCLVGSTPSVGPHPEWGSCEIANTVWCTTASCFLEDVFTFPTERFKSFEGKFDEGGAQVHVQPLS